MKLTSVEEKLLKKIDEAQLITRIELREFMRKNNSVSGKDAISMLDTATRGLIEKDLVSVINPVGSTCYLITKSGAKFLHGV